MCNLFHLSSSGGFSTKYKAEDLTLILFMHPSWFANVCYIFGIHGLQYYSYETLYFS